MEVGIVGQGFVGTAVREGLKGHHNVHTYDKFKPGSSTMNLENLVKHSEVIFVCVPTPMDVDTGVAHTGIVESVITQIDELCAEVGNMPTLIIKSTVPPGTTLRMHESVNYCDVIFSPEFLTEANAINDFKNQTRTVLGVPTGVDASNVVKMFETAMPNATVYTAKPAEAEMCKYITNNFLTVKVSFANEMYDICDAQNIDYNEAVALAKLDDRLGQSHWMVPGPDGDRGYGGHCFPKDIAATRYVASQDNVPTPVLDAAVKTNNRVRTDLDWMTQEGRAVIKTKS
jgi:UDPglucose 6-dehydrogenase